MLRKSFSFALIAILLALPALASPTPPAKAPETPLTATDLEGWEEFGGDDDGIVTWRKEIKDSPIVAFRGEATVDGSIAKVVQVLSDTKRKTEWVHNAEEAKDIDLISDTERVEYNHTGTPIVLKDRDFVFHAVTELKRESKQVIVTFKSVDHPKAPKTDYVRGKLMNSRYILTALGPSKTRVLVEIHADPMGSVAKWIVNLFQKAWPRNTLEGIRRQVAKKDVPEHAKIKNFFAGTL